MLVCLRYEGEQGKQTKQRQEKNPHFYAQHGTRSPAKAFRICNILFLMNNSVVRMFGERTEQPNKTCLGFKFIPSFLENSFFPPTSPIHRCLFRIVHVSRGHLDRTVALPQLFFEFHDRLQKKKSMSEARLSKQENLAVCQDNITIFISMGKRRIKKRKRKK